MTGISLLLLRAVLGGSVLLEGTFYIVEPNTTAMDWLVGLSALGFGSLLVIGFLTPISSVIIGMGALGVVLSWLPSCTSNLFDSKPAQVFALAMLLSIIGAGPGRFSVDARLFGRREIIIPLPESRPGR